VTITSQQQWNFLPCPLCGNSGIFLPVKVPRRDDHIAQYGALYQGKSQSDWKICGACGFVHQNPRPTIDALNRFYLKAQYREEVPTPEVTSYPAFAHWYYKEKVDYAIAHSGLAAGTVFDVGCGYGATLLVFRDKGWNCLGLEADGRCCQFAREALGLSGVTQGVLDQRTQPDSAVDLVFSNHAFEHFADLDEVMKGMTRILNPGGYVMTAVPTYFENRSGLSKAWMNSAHYSLFTHRSLNQLFSRYGFEEVSHTYRGWRKEVDDLWHVARFTGVHHEPAVFYEDAGQVSRYLHVVNPVRSLVYAPMYAGYAKRIQFLRTVSNLYAILKKSPRAFFAKAAKRLGKLFRVVPTDISRP
jgi:2-polyprenyl-3-methyl-5-hydroxy-6-metoxy-1,4-benzoquinol methylase